jgi:hypothetical protein
MYKRIAVFELPRLISYEDELFTGLSSPHTRFKEEAFSNFSNLLISTSLSSPQAACSVPASPVSSGSSGSPICADKKELFDKFLRKLNRILEVMHFRRARGYQWPDLMPRNKYFLRLTRQGINLTQAVFGRANIGMVYSFFCKAMEIGLMYDGPFIGMRTFKTNDQMVIFMSLNDRETLRDKWDTAALKKRHIALGRSAAKKGQSWIDNTRGLQVGIQVLAERRLQAWGRAYINKLQKLVNLLRNETVPIEKEALLTKLRTMQNGDHYVVINNLRFTAQELEDALYILERNEEIENMGQLPPARIEEHWRRIWHHLQHNVFDLMPEIMRAYLIFLERFPGFFFREDSLFPDCFKDLLKDKVIAGKEILVSTRLWNELIFQGLLDRSGVPTRHFQRKWQALMQRDWLLEPNTRFFLEKAGLAITPELLDEIKQIVEAVQKRRKTALPDDFIVQELRTYTERTSSTLPKELSTLAVGEMLKISQIPEGEKTKALQTKIQDSYFSTLSRIMALKDILKAYDDGHTESIAALRQSWFRLRHLRLATSCIAHGLFVAHSNEQDLSHMRYFVVHIVRSTALRTVGDDGQVVVLRKSIKIEELAVRVNETPYAEEHGMAIPMAVRSSDELGLVLDPEAKLANWAVWDWDMVNGLAFLLNPSQRQFNKLHGMLDFYSVSQNPQAGSSICEIAHFQIQKLNLQETPVFTLSGQPLFSFAAFTGKADDCAEIVQVGKSKDALYLRFVLSDPTSYCFNRLLQDLKVFLLLHFGGRNFVDFVYHVVIDRTSLKFHCILAPVCQLKKGLTDYDLENERGVHRAHAELPKGILDIGTMRGLILVHNAEDHFHKWQDRGWELMQNLYDFNAKNGMRAALEDFFSQYELKSSED